jgi:hypothetical protein
MIPGSDRKFFSHKKCIFAILIIRWYQTFDLFVLRYIGWIANKKRDRNVSSSWKIPSEAKKKNASSNIPDIHRPHRDDMLRYLTFLRANHSCRSLGAAGDDVAASS